VAWSYRPSGSLSCHFCGAYVGHQQGGGYVLLPCSNTERRHALNALPLVVKDRCFNVRMDRSFLKFPLAVQHLAAMVRVHPFKHTAFSPYNRSWFQRRVPSTFTLMTDLQSMVLSCHSIWVNIKFFADIATFPLYPHIEFWALDGIFSTPLLQTAHWKAPVTENVQPGSRHHTIGFRHVNSPFLWF
jgi:hypothetical protein